MEDGLNWVGQLARVCYTHENAGGHAYQGRELDGRWLLGLAGRASGRAYTLVIPAASRQARHMRAAILACVSIHRSMQPAAQRRTCRILHALQWSFYLPTPGWSAISQLQKRVRERAEADDVFKGTHTKIPAADRAALSLLLSPSLSPSSLLFQLSVLFVPSPTGASSLRRFAVR